MRKMYSLLTLICIMLTACGNTTEPAPATSSQVVDTPSVSTPVVVEDQIKDTPVEPAAEDYAPKQDEETPKTKNNPEDYYVDGAFYPKEYAISLGFKEYEGSKTEDCLGITHNGIEYFIDIDWNMCSVYWTTGNRCYGATLYELSGSDYSDECYIKTGNIVKGDSMIYLNHLINFIDRIASGKDLDIKNWVSDYSDATYAYGEFDCVPEYYEDGFINPKSFTNTDVEASYTYAYYGNK